MTLWTHWSIAMRWWRKKTTQYHLIISASPILCSISFMKLSYMSRAPPIIQQMVLAQHTRSYANKSWANETKAKATGIVSGNIQSWHHPPSSHKKKWCPFFIKEKRSFWKEIQLQIFVWRKQWQQRKCSYSWICQESAFHFHKDDATASFTIHLQTIFKK